MIFDTARFLRASAPGYIEKSIYTLFGEPISNIVSRYTLTVALINFIL